MSFLAHEAAHLDEPRRSSRRAGGPAGRCSPASRSAAPATSRPSRSPRSSARTCSGTPALAGAPSAAVVFGAAVGAIALSSIMARRGRRARPDDGLPVRHPRRADRDGRGHPPILPAAHPRHVRHRLRQLVQQPVALCRGGPRGAEAARRRDRARRLGLDGRRHRRAVARADRGRSRGERRAADARRPVPGAGRCSSSAAAALTFLFLRPDPFALAHEIEHPRDDRRAARCRSGEILLGPAVLAAIAALIAGQATMVLIMTMTPLHLTDHDHGLGTVGLVISGHVAGMFALAPLSGWISQRFGNIRTIFLGTAVLVAASLLAGLAPPERDEILFVALFLLGWGWNLGLRRRAARCSPRASSSRRGRASRALADAVIWTTSALASLGSGAVVAAAGFSTLGFLGVALVLAPVWLLLNRRPRDRRGDRELAGGYASATSSRTSHAASVRAQSTTSVIETHSFAECASALVARPEDHRRRVAVVDEQAHVGAVRLAGHRRSRGPGRPRRRRRARPAAGGRRGPATTRTCHRSARPSPGARAGTDRASFASSMQRCRSRSASRHVWPSFTP